MYTINYSFDKESYQDVLNAYQVTYTLAANNQRLAFLYNLLIWLMIGSILFVGFQIRDTIAIGSPIFLGLAILAGCFPASWYLNRFFFSRYQKALMDDLSKGFCESSVTFNDAGLEIRGPNATFKTGWAGIKRIFRFKHILILNCEIASVAVPISENAVMKASEDEILEALERLSGRQIEMIAE